MTPEQPPISGSPQETLPAVPAPVAARPLDLWSDSPAQGGWYDGPLRQSASRTGSGLNAGMFLRWKWTIVLVFLTVSGIAIPCIWKFITPLYTARAAVYVSPRVSRLIYDTEENGVVPLYHQYMNTQAQIIKSPEVLKAVLDAPGVSKTRWLQAPKRPLWGEPPSDTDRLKDALMVTGSKQSEVISVTFTAESPEDAKTIVEEVVSQYDSFYRKMESDADGVKRKELEKRVKELDTKIGDSQKDLSDLSIKLGTLTPEELRSQQSTILGELESKHAEVERQLELAKYDLEDLATPDATAQPTDAQDGDVRANVSAPSGYADDAQWRLLNQTLRAREHELKLAELQFGSAHLKIAQLNADVQHARSLLQEREAQLDAGAGIVTLAGPGDHGIQSRADLERRVRRLGKERDLLWEGVVDQRERVDKASADANELARISA
jgi:uncharacterized protein involved in exopolysaccharide biosynthesis